LVELARQWRNRRLVEIIATPAAAAGSVENDEKNPSKRLFLSGNGLPLNPAGRTGLGKYNLISTDCKNIFK
jgi:hypothetical protein